MPRKTKTTAMADKAAQPQFSAELLEQLTPGPVTPAELEGLFQQFKKPVLARLKAKKLHHGAKLPRHKFIGAYAEGFAFGLAAGGCLQHQCEQPRTGILNASRAVEHFSGVEIHVFIHAPVKA